MFIRNSGFDVLLHGVVAVGNKWSRQFNNMSSRRGRLIRFEGSVECGFF